MKFIRLLVLILLWISPYAYAQNPHAQTSETAYYQELQKLTTEADVSSMDLDENILIMGSERENVESVTEAGAAYIYKLNVVTGQYEKKQKLIASDGIDNDHFGSSVAISGDTIAIVAHGNWVYGTGENSLIYIFQEKADGSFEQIQKLLINEGLSRVFLDGDRLVTSKGQVYKRQNGEFVITETINIDQYGLYGISSFDNNTIIASNAYEEIDGKMYAGAVYVYRLNSTTGYFEMTQKMIAPIVQEEGRFGGSIALNNDTLIISLRENPDTEPEAYSLYVYKYDSSSGKFKKTQSFAKPGSGGCSVNKSMSLYDNKLMIADPNNQDPESSAIYFYERSSESDPFYSTKTINTNAYRLGDIEIGEKRALARAGDNDGVALLVFGTDAKVPLTPILYLLGM